MHRVIPRALHPRVRAGSWPWQEPASPDLLPDDLLPDDLLPDATLVTIVTPNLNHGSFLETALRSVLLQDYRNIEYIVVDGGSTDRSIKVLRHYASAITLVEAPGTNPMEALQVGFAAGSGHICGWLNADDLLLPGAISAVVAAFRPSSADVIYGNGFRVDREGRYIDVHIPPRRVTPSVMRTGSWLPQQSVFFTKAILNESGGFRDIRSRVAFDYELFAHMFRSGARFQRIPAFIGSFRVHSESITGSSTCDPWEDVLSISESLFGTASGGTLRSRIDSLRTSLAWRLRKVGWLATHLRQNIDALVPDPSAAHRLEDAPTRIIDLPNVSRSLVMSHRQSHKRYLT